MKRNPAIDLFRLLLMMGILVLHLISMEQYWTQMRHVAYLLLPCVDGFVLITGYFGLRFSIRKIVMLYLVAFWSLLMVCGLQHFLDGGVCVCEYFRLFKELWFLHAYALMMCFTPMVEAVFDSSNNLKAKAILMPVLFVVFGWGLASQVAGIHHFVPSMAGLTPKSGFTLLGVYVIGRLYRLHEDRFDALPMYVYVLAFLMLGCLCTLGMGWLGAYNFPIAVLFALSAFHVVKRWIVLPRFVERMVVWLSPSVFAIYVLHANDYSYRIMAHMVEALRSFVPMGMAFALVAILVFCICLMIDLIRRFLFSFLYGMFESGGNTWAHLRAKT